MESLSPREIIIRNFCSFLKMSFIHTYFSFTLQMEVMYYWGNNESTLLPKSTIRSLFFLSLCNLNIETFFVFGNNFLMYSVLFCFVFYHKMLVLTSGLNCSVLINKDLFVF